MLVFCGDTILGFESSIYSLAGASWSVVAKEEVHTSVNCPLIYCFFYADLYPSSLTLDSSIHPFNAILYHKQTIIIT